MKEWIQDYKKISLQSLDRSCGSEGRCLPLLSLVLTYLPYLLPHLDVLGCYLPLVGTCHTSVLFRDLTLQLEAR